MTLQESIAAGLPLDQSHVDAANMLMDIERRAMPVLQAIQDCGINCANEIAVVQGNSQFAQAVKRNFMSDQL